MLLGDHSPALGRAVLVGLVSLFLAVFVSGSWVSVGVGSLAYEIRVHGLQTFCCQTCRRLSFPLPCWPPFRSPCQLESRFFQPFLFFASLASGLGARPEVEAAAGAAEGVSSVPILLVGRVISSLAVYSGRGKY